MFSSERRKIFLLFCSSVLTRWFCAGACTVSAGDDMCCWDMLAPTMRARYSRVYRRTFCVAFLALAREVMTKDDDVKPRIFSNIFYMNPFTIGNTKKCYSIIVSCTRTLSMSANPPAHSSSSSSFSFFRRRRRRHRCYLHLYF